MNSQDARHFQEVWRGDPDQRHAPAWVCPDLFECPNTMNFSTHITHLSIFDAKKISDLFYFFLRSTLIAAASILFDFTVHTPNHHTHIFCWIDNHNNAAKVQGSCFNGKKTDYSFRWCFCFLVSVTFPPSLPSTPFTRCCQQAHCQGPNHHFATRRGQLRAPSQSMPPPLPCLHPFTTSFAPTT